METSKYLPIGTTVADKYEIVDILGEDDFEILYLVRDFQRKTSFFVLKELFLETFSLRNGDLVSSVPEAEGVFAKRKKQIIEEVNHKRLNLDSNEIKIYGYEEENNTIYTVMEFSNNANLDRYLQFTPNKGVNSLPALDELVDEENEKNNFAFYLKIFLLLVTLFVGVFYGYQYFKQKSIDTHDVVLKSVDAIQKEYEVKLVEEPLVEKGLITKIDTNSSEENSSIKEIVSTVHVLIENNISDEINVTIVSQNKPLVEVVEEENLTLITAPIVKELPVQELEFYEPIDVRIKEFLDTYIDSSSSGKIRDTLKYYDTRVKRYFKFRNATHSIIRKSKQRYNKKWRTRSFKIINFKIVKSYKKKSINYFDLKTTTIWKVMSKRGKKLSGKSRGRMILKEVKGGFKIVSIFTVK